MKTTNRPSLKRTLNSLPQLKGLTDNEIRIIFVQQLKRNNNLIKALNNMKTTNSAVTPVQGTETAKPETKSERKLSKMERKALKREEAKKEAAELLAKSKQAEKAKPAVDEKPKKKKSEASETLKDANAAAVVSKITDQKELKYIYPVECQEGGTKMELLERRKKFRAGVRRKVDAFEKVVAKLMSEEKPDEKAIGKAQSEFNKYAKSVLVGYKAPATDPAKAPKKKKKIAKAVTA